MCETEVTDLNPQTGRKDGPLHTLGKSKCAVDLCSILLRTNPRKLGWTKKLLDRYRDGLKAIASMDSNPGIKKTILTDWRHKFINQAQGKLKPEEGQTHLINLLVTEYKVAIHES